MLLVSPSSNVISMLLHDDSTFYMWQDLRLPCVLNN